MAGKGLQIFAADVKCGLKRRFCQHFQPQLRLNVRPWSVYGHSDCIHKKRREIAPEWPQMCDKLSFYKGFVAVQSQNVCSAD